MIRFPSPSFRRPTKRQAFTLLELLVAMSVLALLLVLLLSMVNGATKLWRANENRVDSYREARAAINLIASDLASIYACPNANYVIDPNLKTFYTHTKNDHLPVTPVSVKNMDGSLFFLTATPTGAQEQDKNKSDLCTVGYYLGFDKTSLTGKGAASYNLYRYFRSSDDTFKAMTKGMPAGSSPQNGDILTDVTIDTSPTNNNQGGSSEVLAKNITGFTVKSYTIPPPANPGDAYGTPVEFDKSADTPLPDMIEITVTAISNDAAKRFTGVSGAADKSQWENADSPTRKQNDREFKARIYLPGASQLRKNALASQFPTPSPTP